MAFSRNILILGAFVTTLIWSSVASLPDGHTHIWVLSSKNDRSLIIKSGDGRFALVNPSSSSTFLSRIGEKMPFYQREIDLVILTKSGQSSLSVINSLRRRYRVSQIWGSSGPIDVSKDNKMDQYGDVGSGWSSLRVQLFRLPKEDGVVKLSQNSLSLLFAAKGNSALWQAVPDWLPVTYLVGPVAASKSDSQILINRFKPKFVIRDVQDEEEIVW